MPSRRTVLALLASGLTGCASESPLPQPTDGKSPPSTASEYDLPPVPTPSEAALERWCAPGTGVAAKRLTVLGEALGAEESEVRVGFTGNSDLLTDVPTVVVTGVVDDAAVGEHAYLAAVEFEDGELTVAVEPGYRTNTGTQTGVGMAMGVRYTAEIAVGEGFPETVRIDHHGEQVAQVAGPC